MLSHLAVMRIQAWTEANMLALSSMDIRKVSISNESAEMPNQSNL